MSPREAANIHPEKHNILVFLSNTLFPPFYVPFPSLFPISKNGRYLGGTWEELGRNVFVLPSLLLCFPIDTKAKFYRRQSEVLSKTYRTPIEDLSNIYRTSIEDLSKTYRTSIEHLSKTYRTSIEDLSKRSWVRFLILSPYGLSVMPKKKCANIYFDTPSFYHFIIK